MRERTTGARIALAALFAALLGAGACSVDPVRDLERKAIGMRPRLLETCLPEASRVEIEDDVERLTYAWTLGERLAGELATDLESIPDPRDEILADSFRDDTPGPRAGGVACEVTLEVEDGLVRKIELAGPPVSDAACATRVRACLKDARER